MILKSEAIVKGFSKVMRPHFSSELLGQIAHASNPVRMNELMGQMFEVNLPFTNL